jgi:threonylcarbamoyladenosine tRNA methylthiotransferase MtaB
MPESATEPDAAAIFKRQRERAFIKVQDGCRYRCTYCIVTVARGEEVSRSEEDIITEVNHLVDAGVKEIVLTGVHVGGYGSDMGSSLYQLVERLLKDTRVPRIRFASVEPWDLPPNFFSLFENKRLMPHMHLPIQSGSDAVLRRMSRRCKRDEFLQLVEQARKANPLFNITTDIIVGFPGETDDDFLRSLSIVDAAEFGHVHIFSFSPREGTKAARLDNQVDEKIKKERSRILHQCAAKVKQSVLTKQIGTRAQVLVEGKGRRSLQGVNIWSGHTENYHKVEFSCDSELDIANEIVEVKILGVDTDALHLRGELITKPRAKKLLIQNS